ncbi:MAG TPA: SRPBCC family protein [Gammaproteobacteria bacterium]|nr:SRPBCC family protein [Gammaproteobacteria bacterium]
MRTLGLLLCLFSTPGAAAQFYSLEVSHDDGLYKMVANVHLEAPPDEVYKVLTDYEHLTRVSSSVVKSTLVRRVDPVTALVYTDTRICTFLFCRHARELQRIEQTSPLDLSAVVVPQLANNIKSGNATLHVEAEQGGTRMHWELSIEPGFWVPPWIGPLLLSSSLRAESERSVAGIEKLARERALLPPLDGTHDDDKPKD